MSEEASRPPVREKPSEPVVVRTLVGHRQASLALRCLGSLVQHSDRPVALCIHDDGTLTAADGSAFAASLPGSRLVSRRDADEAVLPRLARHPDCSAFRAASPLALKLFDVALLSGNELAYCDSDVLFLRPFRGLFDWGDTDADLAFMSDVKDAYALRPWHVSPVSTRAVLACANTGLIHARRPADLDLDHLEHLLGDRRTRAVFARRGYWLEQTCWAVLGARCASQLFDVSQIRVVDADCDLHSPALVAAHFVSTFRSRIGEGPGVTATPGSADAIAVRRSPAPHANSAQLLWSDARRRWESVRGIAQRQASSR